MQTKQTKSVEAIQELPSTALETVHGGLFFGESIWGELGKFALEQMHSKEGISGEWEDRA